MYATWEILSWNRNGCWSTCGFTLCSGGFSSIRESHIWKFDSDCNMSWTLSSSLYGNSSQGKHGMVKNVIKYTKKAGNSVSRFKTIIASMTPQAVRWRVCFWVSAVPAALLALCMEVCAESPHWLHKRGRVAEAEAEFERLLGGPHVKSAVAELSRSDRGNDAEGVKLSELFYGRHFKVVFIGSMLFALQQLSGINALFYFSSIVFKRAGVPSDTANICVGVANLSGSIIAMLLMDKLGRRILLFGSFLGMALAMGLQASAARLHFLGSSTLYLSVGGTLMFVLAFALGAGPVPGLLLPEIFPNKIRAKAMAVCMSVHWVVNFFVGLLFLRLLETLGDGVLYTIFAIVCLIAAAFVKRNVVETKGKSLQEIEIALLPPE